MSDNPKNTEEIKGNPESIRMNENVEGVAMKTASIHADQAVAFEHFLRNRYASKPVDLPFSKRYKAKIDQTPDLSEDELEKIALSHEPMQSIPLTLPIELYGKDKAGRRRKRTSTQARIETRDGELHLTGYQGGGRKKSDSQKLQFIGVSQVSVQDQVLLPHVVVDLDQGTLELKVLPSRPALREWSSDSELARYCRADLNGTQQEQQPEPQLPEEEPEIPEVERSSEVEPDTEIGTEISPKTFTTSSTNASGAEAKLRDEAYNLVNAASRQHAFVQADKALDRVASYDFAACEYLFEPGEGIKSLVPEGLSDAALELLDSIEAAGLDTLLYIDFFQELEAGFLNAAIELNKDRPTVFVRKLLHLLYEDAEFAVVLNWLYHWFASGNISLAPGEMTRVIRRWLHDGDRSYETRFQEVTYASPMSEFHNLLLDIWRHRDFHLNMYLPNKTTMPILSQQYPFTVFTPNSVNLGLRLVYRQDWKLLGVQPGEVVKTIPLGPGQSMKTSTKVTRRHKMDLARDTSRVVERSSESADTVKDSSEVVRETAESHNWEIATEGSFGYGFGLISAECTRGPSYGGEIANKSTARSTNLNEKVRKTASKTQTETKVHVATERESTFESETATEIRNPNDEVAITFEYLHLQHLYETFTRLAEVDSVVFVAEDIPAPSEINFDWVRRHAWILSKVLLDEVFRPALEDIVNDNEAEDPHASSTSEQMKILLTQAANQFATFSGAGGSDAGGLTIPDIYGGAVKIYQEWAAEQHAIVRMRKARETRRLRLFEHIRDNILHYCRAIWTHEDVDQRMLRYRKRKVEIPAEWIWDGSDDPQHLLRYSVKPDPGNMVPLERVIEPTPPIDFVGNYAVHRYRPLGVQIPKKKGKITLDTLMLLLRGYYVDPHDEFAILDPAFLQELERAEAHSDLTNSEVLDVVHYLPRLRDRLLDEDGITIRNPIHKGKLLYPVSAADWAEYCFRKRHSDRVLFASGNLYLDLRVGMGSAMEPFKRLHRSVDVLHRIAEWHTVEIDSLRRELRLGVPNYDDPDIERMTIVHTDHPLDVNVTSGLEDDGD